MCFLSVGLTVAVRFLLNKFLNISALTPAHGNEVTNGDPNKHLNISVLTPTHGIEITNGNPNKLFNISVLTPNPNFGNGVPQPEQALKHKCTDTNA